LGKKGQKGGFRFFSFSKKSQGGWGFFSFFETRGGGQTSRVPRWGGKGKLFWGKHISVFGEQNFFISNKNKPTWGEPFLFPKKGDFGKKFLGLFS